MSHIESTSHSFIVKIWLEETVEESGKAQWCGYITHVSDGERLYLRNLNEIVVFITPYLASMGVKTGFWQKLKTWLSH